MLAGRNGPSTSWAQPSGISLAADGSRLWVADSESSAVRSMSLATGGSQASHSTGSAMMLERCSCRGTKLMHQTLSVRSNSEAFSQ